MNTLLNWKLLRTNFFSLKLSLQTKNHRVKQSEVLSLQPPNTKEINKRETRALLRRMCSRTRGFSFILEI